jgi:polyhydroxyalkanoic acid synthase PhaR subunit
LTRIRERKGILGGVRLSSNYLDPFAVWKTFYQEAEPKLTEAMHKMLESEEYAAASGKMLKNTLVMEKFQTKLMEQTLRNHKIPTVDDIARLAELIIGLEEKFEQAEEKIVSMEKQLNELKMINEHLFKLTDQMEVFNLYFNSIQLVNNDQNKSGGKAKAVTK